MNQNPDDKPAGNLPLDGSPNDEHVAPLPVGTRRCPICSKPAQAAYRPFCSKRCADVDLNRWFTGSYAVPASAEDGPDRPRDEDDEG